MSRKKRVLSGRLKAVEVHSTCLRLTAQWMEDRTRLIQITVFKQDVPLLLDAIRTFQQGPQPAVSDEANDADIRRHIHGKTHQGIRIVDLGDD